MERWVPPTPRCLHPVEFRNVNEPRDDLSPVCWRRAGHANPGRHLSLYAYLRELERSRGKNRRKYPQYR